MLSLLVSLAGGLFVQLLWLPFPPSRRLFEHLRFWAFSSLLLRLLLQLGYSLLESPLVAWGGVVPIPH